MSGDPVGFTALKNLQQKITNTTASFNEAIASANGCFQRLENDDSNNMRTIEFVDKCIEKTLKRLEVLNYEVNKTGAYFSQVRNMLAYKKAQLQSVNEQNRQFANLLLQGPSGLPMIENQQARRSNSAARDLQEATERLALGGGNKDDEDDE